MLDGKRFKVWESIIADEYFPNKLGQLFEIFIPRYKMILKRIKLDLPYVGETNCYIIQDEKTKEVIQ